MSKLQEHDVRSNQLLDALEPASRKRIDPYFKSETWNGVVAPAGTSQEVIDKVASAIQAAVKEKSILDRFDTYGVEAIGAGPAEFKTIMLDDIAKWKAAIAAANIKL